MLRYKLISMALASSCLASPLLAQTEQEKDEKKLTRTLRVIMAGKRPLPAFEKRGDRYIEVDPPLSKIPPTIFAFTDPSHAPRAKSPDNRKTEYSAWPNKLVRINQYKGPSNLQLTIKRPLVSNSESGTELTCNLDKALHPLVLVHPDSGKAGWNKPQAKVINMSPDNLPPRSITVANLSDHPIKVYLTKKGEVIAPNKSKHLKIPTAYKKSFRYRIDTSNGKKLVTVSNSSHQLRDNTRIIMLALPGEKSKKNPFGKPTIRIISDST